MVVEHSRCVAWRNGASLGEAPKTSRIVSLNCRTLPNPAAKAISVNESDVVSTSSRAV